MIPTLRRSRDDVFLIGEEQILGGPAAADPASLFTTESEDGYSSRDLPRPPRTTGSLHGARGLALAGLATGTLAVVAVLELGGGGGSAHRIRTLSPRTPLISRSIARVPAAPTTRVRSRVARPVEVHRPNVVHQHRPRPVEVPVQVRPTVTAAEPEREPTLPMAPVSRPAVTPTEATAVPEVAPQVAAESTDPGPPPPSSGGGPGVESFGFER